MWRIVAGGVIVAGLTTGCASNDRDCELASVVDEAIGNANPRSCGFLLSTPFGETDLTPWRDAHDCVITLSSRGEPFVVRWQPAGLDTSVKIALVGRLSGTELSVARFESRVGVGEPGGTTEYACDLRDTGNCAEVEGSLCLDCGPRVVTDRCDSGQ